MVRCGGLLPAINGDALVGSGVTLTPDSVVPQERVRGEEHTKPEGRVPGTRAVTDPIHQWRILVGQCTLAYRTTGDRGDARYLAPPP